MTKQSAFETLCDALWASIHMKSYDHMTEFFDKIKAEHAALLAERDALREELAKDFIHRSSSVLRNAATQWAQENPDEFQKALTPERTEG